VGIRYNASSRVGLDSNLRISKKLIKVAFLPYSGFAQASALN